MSESLHQKFIIVLIEKYGDWEKLTSRFGNTTFGEIADDLCISASQFSKLIYGSATEGMYLRSIRNVKQLQSFEILKEDKKQLSQEIRKLNEKIHDEGSRFNFFLKYPLLSAFGSLFIGFILATTYFRIKTDVKEQVDSPNILEHSLAEFFDRDFKSDFISPFISEADAQEFCPCSAFEGTWVLDKEYIIPLPGRKPGLYYVAKSIDNRMKCLRSVENDKIGMKLIGFENLYHEIWLDKNREALPPRYFNTENKSYPEEFYNLEFESSSNFSLVAKIRSFQFSEFEIDNETITRRGEPSGRYASFVDHNLTQEFEIDVKHILENVIGSLVRFNCATAINKYCNPNDIQLGSVIEFDCNFTISTENLGIGGGYPYVKGYKLTNQVFSDNLLCGCVE